MKTLIIAFWMIDLRTLKESNTFRLNKSITGMIEENKFNIVSFKEEHFTQQFKMTEKSRVKFMKDFISEQFLYTKCQSMIVVMNELLKESFLKKIGYRKMIRKDFDQLQSIPGRALGDEDNVFVYLQDKERLEFFPSCCTLVEGSSTDHKILKITGHFNFN